MAFNQTYQPLDPNFKGLPAMGTPSFSTGAIANCVLAKLREGLWLATFSITYASVPATAFANHGMEQGEAVIIKASDATHVWLMGVNGAQDVVY